MKNFYLADLFQTNTMANIIYSSYITDYYLFFTLLLIGYFTICYYTAYIIGNIPYINKLFNFQWFLSFIVIAPILFMSIKVIFNINSSSIFLENYLFIAILSSITTLVFIYSGTNQLLKKQYKIIQLYKDYSVSIITILLVSIYYYNSQFSQNRNEVTRTIMKNINKEIRYLKRHNKADYKLAKLILNYKIKSINKYIYDLKIKEKKIINDFNNKIIGYNNKYIALSEKIANSNKLIINLEQAYKNKIKIVDKEIDEERLRLKSVYEEWKNNVENNIGNLNKLSKKYKVEIQALENSKDLITHLQNELKLIKQKNSQSNIELLKVNDLISKNRNDIKSKDKLFKKLSNDIKQDNTNISSISKASYEEWKNNVENNIDNLNKLSKKYSLEIKALENNKDLMPHLQNELKLIKKKNSQLNIELSKVSDLISKNKNNIKSKDKLLKKLSNDIKKDKTNINSISKTSSKNSININNQRKEIAKIKKIQVQINKNKKNLDLIKLKIDTINKMAKKK